MEAYQHWFDSKEEEAPILKSFDTVERMESGAQVETPGTNTTATPEEVTSAAVGDWDAPVISGRNGDFHQLRKVRIYEGEITKKPS